MNFSGHNLHSQTLSSIPAIGMTEDVMPSKRRLAFWARALLFLWIWWFSGAWFFPSSSQAADAVQAPGLFLLRMASYGFILLFGWHLGLAGLIDFCKRRIWLTLFFFYCAASLLWTSAGIISVYRFIDVISIIVLSAYVQQRMGPESFINVLYFTLTSILALSAVFIFLLPHYGVMDGIHAGKFRGLFSHKNNFGIFLACYVVFSTYFFREIRFSGLLKGLFVAASLFFLVKTQSASAVVFVFTFFLFLLAVSLTSKATRTFFKAYYIFFLLIAAYVAGIYLLYDYVFVVLDRSETFTGRSSIWQYYYRLAMQKSLFGHGFFSIEDDPLLSKMAESLFYFAARSPHNAYLGIFYSFGYVGFALYMAFLLSTMFGNLTTALTAETARDARMAAFGVCLTVCASVYAMVETYQAGFSPGLPLLLILTTQVVTARKFKGLPK